ncbi:hypothetical protein H5410_056950 [Solanum commersonii]|uniref:Uncharacterized protein n=1 Tax=Solanum commersonii TaxID=4109 RepID=A0A9J5WP71_SOLCO|nr:hypothetical protein H5410_056950 [Solanum commersonii]
MLVIQEIIMNSYKHSIAATGNFMLKLDLGKAFDNMNAINATSMEIICLLKGSELAFHLNCFPLIIETDSTEVLAEETAESNKTSEKATR